MYSPTCFGRLHAHHQELNNCSSSLWFYSWSMVVAVVLIAVGPVVDNRPDQYQQHCYRHAPTIKPEAATAVVELLIMGVRTPETCWAVHKRQVINLRNCCVKLVDLFEYHTYVCCWLLCTISTTWPQISNSSMDLSNYFISVQLHDTCTNGTLFGFR